MSDPDNIGPHVLSWVLVCPEVFGDRNSYSLVACMKWNSMPEATREEKPLGISSSLFKTSKV